MSYVSEKQIKQIAQKISDDYAQKNGSYDEFIAGSTKQILSTIKINDQVPYIFRTSGGSADIGDRLDDTIVGGTIVWNQRRGNNGPTMTGGTKTKLSDSIYRVTPDNPDSVCRARWYNEWKSGHKYMLNIIGVDQNRNNVLLNYYDGSYHTSTSPINKIIAPNATSASNGTYGIYWTDSDPSKGYGYVDISANLFDLTQMFGPTVADYIYSLGDVAGVAWFKNLFPKDYYAYNAGELLSINVASHDTVGFNAFDVNASDAISGYYLDASGVETAGIGSFISGYIPVIPNMNYYISALYVTDNYRKSVWYDADKNLISVIDPTTTGAVFTSPSNAHFLRISYYKSSFSEVCVNLSWDGEKDGEFEEYIKHSYLLDSSLTLRGIPRLDANNKLYYNGDIYESDGTVTRRYGIVDMGTLNWRKATITGSGTVYYHVPFTVCKSGTINMITPKYTTIWTGSLTAQPDKSIWRRYGASNGINIRDDAYAESSEADFKASLSGVYLVYELQTPTTETAIPYQNPQIVDDFGTEEYTNPRSNPEAFSTEKTYNVGNFVSYDGHCYRCITAVTEAGEWDSTKWELDDLIVEVPVGHNTDYYSNLRAKLETAPDSPDGETGNYVVNHTKESGENKYIPFGTAIQNDAGLNNELNGKANIDGYYETLTAGTSEQLLSAVSINDKVPYNFRTSGGSADIGNRLTDKIVGGTISWRQLVMNEHFESSSGWSANNGTFSVADNIATFTASAEGGIFGRGVYLTKGHKYILSAMVKTATETDKVCLHTANSALGSSYTVPSTDWQIIERIYTRSGNTQNVSFGIKDMRISDWDAVQVKYIVVYDITRMFGKTIADYINSLGYKAGIAWFKTIFPKPYYAYNAGELMSVNVSSHDTVGFNAWDEEWEGGSFNPTTGEKVANGTRIRSKNYIPVIPGATYYLKVPAYGNIFEYDADKKYLKYTAVTNATCVLSEDTHYVRILTGSSSTPITTYNNNICLNLSWDGERDGEYEPYVKHSYPLDSSLILRGIPSLDANNKLYYDGDIYESDGTVIRRYDIVDLGTLTWKTSTVTIDGVSTRVFRSVQPQSSLHTLNALISIRYDIHGGSSASVTDMPDKSIIVGTRYYSSDAQFVIRDSDYAEYTEEQFKAAMSGIYLVYELVSTSYTTESADPYTNPQIVDDFGTEEYVDYAYSQRTRDVAIPVGHDTLYMNNLRAKLEMSPDSPDGDGDYIVRQSGGENTYVPLTKELPAAPSEDGNYVLKVAVVDGTPTYSWEAQV